MAIKFDDISDNPMFDQTRSAIFLKDKGDDKLYKVLNFFPDDTIEHIKYNFECASKLSKDIILPTNLILSKSDNVIGYEQRYILGKNMRSALRDAIPLERKIDIVNYLFLRLKELHQYLIACDIKLSNCMVSLDEKDNKGYLIDFDDAIKVENKSIEKCSYFFTDKDNKRIMPSKEEDIIRLFIAAISFLSGCDIEHGCMESSSILWLFKILKKDMFPQELIDYFHYLWEAINNGFLIDDYLNISNNGNFIDEMNSKSRILKKAINYDNLFY